MAGPIPILFLWSFWNRSKSHTREARANESYKEWDIKAAGDSKTLHVDSKESQAHWWRKKALLHVKRQLRHTFWNKDRRDVRFAYLERFKSKARTQIDVPPSLPRNLFLWLDQREVTTIVDNTHYIFTCVCIPYFTSLAGKSGYNVLGLLGLKDLNLFNENSSFSSNGRLRRVTTGTMGTLIYRYGHPSNFVLVGEESLLSFSFRIRCGKCSHKHSNMNLFILLLFRCSNDLTDDRGFSSGTEGRSYRNVRYLMLFHRTPPWKEFTAAIQRNNLFESWINQITENN